MWTACLPQNTKFVAAWDISSKHAAKNVEKHTKAMTLFKENGDEAAADEMRALFARAGWGTGFEDGKKYVRWAISGRVIV